MTNNNLMNVSLFVDGHEFSGESSETNGGPATVASSGVDSQRGSAPLQIGRETIHGCELMRGNPRTHSAT